MSDFSEVVLFGDLTCDYIAGLTALSAIKNDPVLISFLERVTFGLREQIGALPHHERVNLVQFTTFQELLARTQNLPCPHPAFEQALSCTYQLATFIHHYTVTGKPYPTAQNTLLIGLCSGLLSSAAVSCCKSISGLVPVAAHAVLVAFRLGLVVADIRNRIAPTVAGSPPPTWAVLVPGLNSTTALQILQLFNKEKNFSPISATYISTHAPAGITVSGPPASLQALTNGEYLSSKKGIKLAIYAPYHAPHLFSEHDVSDIVKSVTHSELGPSPCHIPILSSVNGEKVAVDTFEEVLRYAANAILREPLRVDQVLSCLTNTLQASGRPCNLLAVATPSGQTFATAIRKLGNVDISLDQSANSHAAYKDEVPSTGKLADSRLAIIGYSGRFPGADNVEEFWKLLHEGKDVHNVVPSNRWNLEHVDPTLKKKNTMATPYGCWLEKPGLFDANFFMISPREAPQIDPAQRLALMTAYEAMEQAGLVPESTPSTQPDRVGVFYGTTSNDWGEINSSQDVDTYYIPGSCRAFIPGRQNFVFKFSGLSYSVDTACSSSLAALHLACNSLLRGDIDTAICGGTNVLTNPDISAGLDRGHFLSRTGNCKTFDDDADGYCRGEGVCTLIVKRLEDAIADKDPICGIIRGAYTNHSAEAESITRPHVGAQKAIFEKVLTGANVDPFSVGYIEMHGTGTQAGDAREMSSVLSVFAAPERRNRTDAERLYLGSAKANVGHGGSVSGVVALIKALQMMEHNEIPPHCGIKNKINHNFPTDLDERNIHIAKKATYWPRPEGGARRVMINNFSAAGGNSSVLVEDSPQAREKLDDSTDLRSCQTVAVSARSSTALAANLKSLLAYIKEQKPSLPSLAYTTTARRTHHAYRVMATGASLDAVVSSLEAKLSSTNMQKKVRAMQPVAFAFTGQGSQYLGMGRELLEFDTFRTDIKRLDTLSQTLGFPSILPLIQQTEGDVADLPATVVQVGTVCIQIALARLWQSWGLSPKAVVGHSLGEYAALNVAGVLSEADTIFVVGSRAAAMEEHTCAGTHAMLAVGAAVEEIDTICQGLEYEIACINSPTETVLSGTVEQVDELLERLSSSTVPKLRRKKLHVPYAFHSAQMQPILETFKNRIQSVTFHKPSIPVISPLLKETLRMQESFGPEYLARHCRETVDLAGALKWAKVNNDVQESTIWVEIGLQPILSGLLRSNLGSMVTALPSLQQKTDSWKTITTSLATLYESGVEIRWIEYHRSFAQSLSVLRLPSYNWDLKEYWMQYVGDWTLYKGDPRPGHLLPTTGLVTTCVHRYVEEKRDGDVHYVFGEADILREDMLPFVRGHKVNNVPLVTPSVYAEMALAMGDYLRKQVLKLNDNMVDLQHMDVQRPFVTKIKEKGPQLLQCHIALNTKTQHAGVEFWSVTPEGKKLTKHAEATITFPDAEKSLAEAESQAEPVRQRMKSVAARLGDDERVQKLTGQTGYQLVSSLAQYDKDFMGVASVLLDSRNREAVATVKFNHARLNSGVFHVDPHLIDNLGQPALFIMNANDEADLTKEVFVNHGWSSLHFYKPLSTDAVYRSHVQMKGPGEDGLYNGDVLVFDENDDVVALYRGIKAQGVPRRLMDYIVHMRDDTTPNGPISHPVKDASAEKDIWPACLAIISEESGIPVAELKPETCFLDVGVDSLLSLMCASRFREELGLHHESTIFIEYPSLRELEQYLKQGQKSDAPAAKLHGNDAILRSMFTDGLDSGAEKSGSDSESVHRHSDTDSGLGITRATTPESKYAEEVRKVAATSLLLQGNPALPTTNKTLFLLPDGSGSCSSYATVPRIDPSIAVVGLNCPFMKDPDLYTCGIDKVASLYIQEIRRRQPTGPYSLGGWSVGGIFAYHVGQELVAQGEAVDDLILIDCPVPRGLDHLPRRYFEYCEEVGLIGTVNGVKKPTPSWLIPHFEACVNSLHDYFARPFEPESLAPRTKIIWAGDAIDTHMDVKFKRVDTDPEGLKFLTAPRIDYGPCGWEDLLPEPTIELGRVAGANHFSMMKDDFAKTLAGYIQEFLSREGA